jgi:hypothetical protein
MAVSETMPLAMRVVQERVPPGLGDRARRHLTEMLQRARAFGHG